MAINKRWTLIPVLGLLLSACDTATVNQTSEPATYNTTEMAMEDSNSMKNEQTEGREIIYSASVSYQTVHYDEAKAAIEEVINQNGGFIQYQEESVNEYRYDDNQDTLTSLNMVIRIPQESYERLLTALEENEHAQLMQVSRGSTDVTQQSRDIEIRIESIESRIDRLNELNDQAENIADLIEIQAALEDAISERDLLLAEQADLSDDVDNATVNLTLREVIELSDRSESQLTFWDRVVNALEQTWQNSIDAFQWGILTLIFLIPYLVFFFILYLIIRYFIRPLTRGLMNNIRQRRSKNKNKKFEEQKENTISKKDEEK
ncbi:DUF4349 domain-containing protein [Aerococcaceae bacterium WGS1372]